MRKLQTVGFGVNYKDEVAKKATAKLDDPVILCP
jgi:hypothetical protein